MNNDIDFGDDYDVDHFNDIDGNHDDIDGDQDDIDGDHDDATDGNRDDDIDDEDDHEDGTDKCVANQYSSITPMSLLTTSKSRRETQASK